MGSKTAKNLGLITALGFASGLPLALSGFTLRMWLSSDHLGLGVIGLTANIGLAYTLKFLWAPVFDEVKPLFWGRRRGWLLSVQTLLLLCIAALGFSDPARHVGVTLGIGALLAFISASQDILIDAWRIETFAPRTQGAALAGYVWGYRAAMLLSGAGVIALSARTGWHEAILLVAGAALLGPAATLLADEPQVARRRAGGGFAAQFAQAVREPLTEFLRRRGAVAIIAFIILFRLGEALAGVMLPPYYTYLGFNRAAIAVANGPVSLAATLAGAALGGALVARLGVGRALLITALFQTAALLMYPALGFFPGHPAMLVATSVVEILRRRLRRRGLPHLPLRPVRPRTYRDTIRAALLPRPPRPAHHRRTLRLHGGGHGIHPVLRHVRLRRTPGDGADAVDFAVLPAGGGAAGFGSK